MKMKFFVFLSVLSAGILTACAAPKEKGGNYDIQPDSAVYYTLGKTMSDVLFDPKKVTCYILKGKAKTEESDYELEPHYVRDSLVAKLKDDKVAILQFELLADEKNYGQDSMKVRSPYVPAIEFCFERKKIQVHVIISLSNFSWTILYDDKRQGNWNYADKRFMERYCKMILGDAYKRF